MQAHNVKLEPNSHNSLRMALVGREGSDPRLMPQQRYLGRDGIKYFRRVERTGVGCDGGAGGTCKQTQARERPCEN